MIVLFEVRLTKWFCNRIHDGVTCTDYSKQSSDYDECIVTRFKEQLLETYGCQNVHPFMNVHCKDNPENARKPKLLEKTHADIDKLTEGLDIDAIRKCLPPCQRNSLH